jgi:hypothetical protein
MAMFDEPEAAAEAVPRIGRRATSAFRLTCLAVLVAACFGGVLLGGGQFAFRDAANFYYPLYSRVQQEWASGRLPLWEPGEDGGRPMLGNPMAAVLYPGKLLFALVPYPWGVRLYTVAHELLAFWAMAALMRSWSVSRTGAALAGLCYAFSGPIVTNYFNIIYLVGAAWLPLGLRSVDGWLRVGRRSALVELTLVLAMQVLGGDPEAAYLTVLCAFGYAVVLASSPSVGPSPVRTGLWGLGIFVTLVLWAWVGPRLAPWIHGWGAAWGQTILALTWIGAILVYGASRRREDRARLGTMLGGVALAGTLAITLSAVQSFPVIDQIAKSVRWAGTGPIDLYDSSLVPYRAFEWVWPNVFGTFTTGNRFWMSLLPPAGPLKIWPLSLYMSALPLVLALGTCAARDRSPCRAWMTAVLILSVWASLGEFADPARWSGRPVSTTVGDGSLYGLLATLVPGLRLFRFPCKLLVLSALALVALAGLGWDRVAIGTGVCRRRVIAITAGLLVLTAIGLAAATGLRHRLVATMAAAGESSHGVLGPLDASGAVAEMLRGLGHGTVALASSLAVVVWSGRRPGPARLAALALVTVDLAVANSRLVIAIPQSDFEREPEVARAIRAAERADPTPGPFRIHRPTSWVPPVWFEAVSTRRLQEFIEWKIDTLEPAFGLLHGFSYVLTDDSQTGRTDYRDLFRPIVRLVDPQTAAQLGVEPGRPVLYHPRRAFDLWGVRYFIIAAYPGDWTRSDRSYAAFRDDTDLIYPDLAAMAGPEEDQRRRHWLWTRDVQVRRNKAVFLRAWIVHTARLIRSLDGTKSATRARDALMVRLGFPDDPTGSDPSRATLDLRAMAYVETDEREALAAYLPGAATDPTEKVTVRYEAPTRAVLEARLQRPGLIVLADLFDPDWHLTIDGRPAPVLRANGLMRAAAVAAGTHTLVYTYEPASVRLGAGVSLVGLIALIGLALWSYQQK